MTRSAPVRLPVAITLIGATLGALLVLGITPLGGWLPGPAGFALVQGLSLVWLAALLVVDVRGWRGYSTRRRRNALTLWAVLALMAIWPFVAG